MLPAVLVVHADCFWRQTAECSSTGRREPKNDRPCNTKISADKSGFCECEPGLRVSPVGCGHSPLTCSATCSNSAYRLSAAVVGPQPRHRPKETRSVPLKASELSDKEEAAPRAQNNERKPTHEKAVAKKAHKKAEGHKKAEAAAREAKPAYEKAVAKKAHKKAEAHTKAEAARETKPAHQKAAKKAPNKAEAASRSQDKETPSAHENAKTVRPVAAEGLKPSPPMSTTTTADPLNGRSCSPGLGSSALPSDADRAEAALRNCRYGCAKSKTSMIALQKSGAAGDATRVSPKLLHPSLVPSWRHHRLGTVGNLAVLLTGQVRTLPLYREVPFAPQLVEKATTPLSVRLSGPSAQSLRAPAELILWPQALRSYLMLLTVSQLVQQYFCAALRDSVTPMSHLLTHRHQRARQLRTYSPHFSAIAPTGVRASLLGTIQSTGCGMESHKTKRGSS